MVEEWKRLEAEAALSNSSSEKVNNQEVIEKKDGGCGEGRKII